MGTTTLRDDTFDDCSGRRSPEAAGELSTQALPTESRTNASPQLVPESLERGWGGR
jgi:hypothetical protein